MPTLPNKKQPIFIKIISVQKRILPITTAIFFFFIIITGCSKLDTTDIGSDLLPAVDNINTFDTLLTINSTQGVFTLDSTKVANTEDQVVGKITTDPLFGTTAATLYAQFKPTFFPFFYGNASDTIVGFDSVVLCLSYKGFWGDSTLPLQFQVKEVSQGTGGLWDSIYQSKTVNYFPQTNGSVLGTAQVDVRGLRNTFIYSNHKDSAVNQVRINLSGSAFANLLYTMDSASATSAFRSDSLFKLFNNGLAILVTAGNGLLYTNLTDSSSKLEVHFRRKNAGVLDTTYSAFRVATSFGSSISPSATVDNIIRNRPAQVTNPAPGEIYLQATPGTYANLSIPALSTISNRIIHRAEIIVEQIPNNPVLDGYMSAPSYLYLDQKDTGTTDKWKPVYYDLNPSTAYDPDYKTSYFYPSASGVDFGYFGGFVRDKNDVFGNPIRYYNINITRDVQQIVTKHAPNYTFRLYAPYEVIYPQHTADVIPFNNRLAYGRVKVGGGNNANYKMRLRIVYSKI